jgi:tetratricopeptide (TPR) repeat protein
VNPFSVASVVAALAAIAAAGVTAGFVRGGPLALEMPPDPLEDRRGELLRSLDDLDEARAAGALDEVRYSALRADTEARIARVLRAIERRELQVARPAESDRAEARPSRRPGTVPGWVVGTLIGATVIAVVVAGLARTTSPVATSGPVASSTDPLAFFEQRVRQHPDDLAARLDLAHRYLDVGRTDDALVQYAVALELDPDDAEAHAHLGLIRYLTGHPEEALVSVRQALQADPSYPEALFIEGVILLRGIHRPAEAIDAFERYLDAAPFGEERSTAAKLIRKARDLAASTADGAGRS